MVRRAIRLLHGEISGLHEAAYLIGAASIGSQLLALLRDRLLAQTFGASRELDLYYSAFRVPDLVFATIASFVSVSVLIPFLVGYLGGEQPQVGKARAFLGTILSVFFVVMGLVIFALSIFALPIARFIAPGFSSTEHLELAGLMRILLFSPLFLGISNIFGGVTQSLKRFYLYSASPILYNIGIIIGVVFLYPRLGIAGVAWGVVFGAVLHAGVQIPFVWSKGLAPRLFREADMKLVLRVVALSIPRTVGLSLSQIVLLVVVALASFLDKGAIAIFTLAFNLQSVPLSIIGASYSVAAFPALAELFVTQGRTAFARRVSSAVRHIIFLSAPATALFFVLRNEIAGSVLGVGKFDIQGISLASTAMAIFVLSLAAQNMILLLVRAYYAAQNTVRPLVINAVSSLLTVAFTFMLMHSPSLQDSALRIAGVGPNDGAEMLILPMALSFGFFINASLLLYLFGKDFPEVEPIGVVWIESTVGALATGLSASYFLPLFATNDTSSGLFFQGFFAGILGLVIWAISLWFMGSRELAEVALQLKRRLYGSPRTL